MAKFRLNKRRVKRTGTYEVHQDTCPHYHSLSSYIDLGEFMFCSTALQRARTLGFSPVDGCKECCAPCHVGE